MFIGIIGLIIFILYQFKNLKFTDVISLIKRTNKIILLGLLLTCVVVFFFYAQTDNFKWIWKGVTETILFFGGNSTGFYEDISQMVIFPQNDELLFGTGSIIFYNELIRSDIGYINDLFLGGILFIIIYYGNILLYTWKSYSKFNNKILGLICVLFLLVSNLKGLAFHRGELLRVFLLISMTANLFTNSDNKKTEI